MPEDWQHGGFGLYVHWPFCQAKCPYCDFNSHVVANVDQNRWVRAYLSEIERVGALTQGRVLQSVFFGGGTPSLMEGRTVDAILTKVRATWPCANTLEVTLEANPTSIEAGRFRDYRDAGVNRVSMGMQALNDSDLKALGRLHTTQEALAAFDIARYAFDRVSFDLIYARQGQSVDAWRTELETALALDPSHLSLYQLTIEDGTAFGDRYAAGKLRGLPDEDASADMYEVTQQVCEAAGLPAYEVSNHAKPDAECRHNRIYWQYGDYAGIGPGAHGRLTLNGVRTATEQIRAPGAWLAQVETAGNGDNLRDVLSDADAETELLLMGLRLSDGVLIERLPSFNTVGFQKNVSELKGLGLIDITDKHLVVTSKGRPILNAVLRQLLGG